MATKWGFRFMAFQGKLYSESPSSVSWTPWRFTDMSLLEEHKEFYYKSSCRICFPLFLPTMKLKHFHTIYDIHILIQANRFERILDLPAGEPDFVPEIRNQKMTVKLYYGLCRISTFTTDLIWFFKKPFFYDISRFCQRGVMKTFTGFYTMPIFYRNNTQWPVLLK